MSTLESLWFKNNRLPKTVRSMSNKMVNAINVAMMNSPMRSNGSSRGKYHDLSECNKLLVARYASHHGTAATMRNIKFGKLHLKESSVRGWRNCYDKSKRKLLRDPKTAEEAGLSPRKRGRKSQLGEDNKNKICDYLQNLRESGADINRYTTAAAIKAYLTATKQEHMLLENRGWINPMNRSLIQEVWKKCNFVKRKKCRKRRGSLRKNPGYLAAQYKLRCKLTKKWHDIPDCLEFNFDETKLPIVPGSAYTMDKKGKKEIKGEKLDDKRCVTGFCGGARTGEAAKMQYISKGKTTRCEPNMVPPDNIIFDHTPSKNSTPASTLRFAQNVIVPFKEAQIEKYALSPDTHALCKWDIFYTHVTSDVLDYLSAHYVHVIVVPPNMTDDLQEMDKHVNKPLKGRLVNNFVNMRASESISQLG